MTQNSLTGRSLTDANAASVAASLLPCWVAMGWLVSKAQWFWRHNPDLQFGWIVLMLCAFLLWEAWEARSAVFYRWTVWALLSAGAGCGALFLTQVYQTAYGLTPASMSGLGLGVLLVVASNLLYVFGWPGLRHFAFGFCFIWLALPIPSVILDPIVVGLQTKVASVNVEVLKLAGIPASRVGSLIQLPNCTVGIDEACSGIRSLQSTVMATLFIGYLSLRRWDLRAALLVAGLLLAFVGNVARSLFLSYLAASRGQEALESAHDTAGWSILVFTVVGVGALAWLLARAEKLAARQEKVREEAV